MTKIPFHLRYTLTRSQRLLVLIRYYGGVFPVFFICSIVGLFGTFLIAAAIKRNLLELAGSALLLLLPAVWLYQHLLFGLLDVLFKRHRAYDIVFEENAAGILIGNTRWYLFLDGVSFIKQYCGDVWTLEHFNGTILHIAASAITEDQLAHIRARMEYGKTPEGMREVVERGKLIQAVMLSDDDESI